jgi:hypothetical protein
LEHGKLARVLLSVFCLSVGGAPVVLAQVGGTVTPQPIAPPGPGPGATGTGSALGSAAATTAAPTVTAPVPGTSPTASVPAFVCLTAADRASKGREL